jgi:hypothetical protein
MVAGRAGPENRPVVASRLIARCAIAPDRVSDSSFAVGLGLRAYHLASLRNFAWCRACSASGVGFAHAFILRGVPIGAVRA